jgi:hypothetical protein
MSECYARIVTLRPFRDIVTDRIIDALDLAVSNQYSRE